MTSQKQKQPKNPPVINTATIDMATLANQSWAALESSNEPPRIFRQGGALWRLEHDDDGNSVIRHINQDQLRYEVARCAKWVNHTPKRKTNAVPPLHVIRDMLVTPDPPLPPLVRITKIPVFTQEGVLLEEPGYDRTSRILYLPQNGLIVPEISKKPTAGDIAKAKDLVAEDMFGDFPFVDKADKAHAIELFLLPFVRSVISGSTPNHVVESPTPGSGKGLLTQAALMPSVGKNLATMAQARDGDEWRKRITACLMRMPEVVVLDNLTAPLDSGELAAVLTTSIWSDRILGKSKTIELPIRCIWVTTANNPVLSTELVRRSIRVRLDARCARPWERSDFKHPNLLGWTEENRGQMIWAGLTLVKS